MSVAPIVASTPARRIRSEASSRPNSFAPEAEIDADVGEHRPGERRGGGKNHRAAHHEDDGQKQGEQTGDADQIPS